MFNKSAYTNNLNKLLMSMNIKIEESPYQIEFYLYKKYGIRKPDYYLDDKKTWKYYINISGNYHFLDQPMYIYNRYTSQDMLLTVDNLKSYPNIRTELLDFSLTYDNLVSKYPLQENLIKSILLPVDIDYAIQSSTGTILAYDTNMVDSNEYSLMAEVQEYIYGWIGRYYISDYALVDDLYISSIFAVLGADLRLKIDNIRLKNVFTYEAHSYYVNNFFRSHLGIDLELNILTDKVKMWLYKNLRYIERHTGKDSTFNLIVSKVLGDSNIGIGEINIIKEDSSYNNQEFNLCSPTYIPGDINFKTKELNSRYIINKNKTYDLEQIIKKELLLPENKELDFEVVTNNEYNSIKSEKYLLENTKILEIDDKIAIRSRTIPELHVLIDNWFLYAFTGRYNYAVDIKDDNTNKIYKVNAKQAALMLIKVFSGIIGQELKPLRNFKTGTTLRYDENLKDNINKLFLDRDTSDALTNKIFDIIPPLPERFIDVNDLKNYLLDVNYLNNVIWYAISNVGNAITSATLKRFQERLYKDDYIDLTINNNEYTVDELLANENVDYYIGDNYDYVSMLKKLVLAFTGLGFNTADEDTADIKQYISLIKKITSYSLQIIYTPVVSSSIESPYTAEEVIMLSKPLITCIDATFTPLEDFYGDLNANQYAWKENTVVENYFEDYTTYDCTGNLGFNYFIDMNNYNTISKINLNMSINNKCLDLYSHEVEISTAVPPEVFINSFMDDADWIDDDNEFSYFALQAPLINTEVIDNIGIDISIDSRDVDININELEIDAYSYNAVNSDVIYDMPSSILSTNNEENIGVIFDDDISSINEKATLNMSLNITGVDLIEENNFLIGLDDKKIIDKLGNYIITI